MRLLNARLIISLIVGVTLVSLCSSYYHVLLQKRGLRRDLQRRAEVLGESLARNVVHDLEWDSQHTLQRTVQQFANREHLAGLAVYDPQGRPIAVTTNLQPLMSSPPAVVQQALKEEHDTNAFLRMGSASIHIYTLPLYQADNLIGGLAIVHDCGYIRAESLHIWRETFLSALAHVFLIALITLLIVRWSIAGPIERTARWMKALRTERTASARIKLSDVELFRPLAREVASFAEILNSARSAAELEARLRDSGESVWTAGRLAANVRSRLRDSRLFVVSNREPYMHTRRGKAVEVIVPSSGLVTAIEPVLRACDGTWLAHGSGDADLETADEHDRLSVPPDDPRYTLRRIWLTKEEEEGYYYGFANEGLWPLCHIAHTRPLFRASDWKHYQEVNQKFGGRSSGRDGKCREAGRISTGLPLCSRAQNDQTEQTRRTLGHLLAHSLAESRGFRHLSLATRISGRIVGR
jgi:trehalose 6-phosphate synthase